MKLYAPGNRRNISGRKIRKARENRGRTQAVLAEKLQAEGLVLNKQTVCLIESGKRIVVDCELSVISDVLNVPFDLLPERT